MIFLTKLKGEQIVLNSDLIQIIESTPDTTISLTTGQNKLIVRESVEDIVKNVIEYKRQIHAEKNVNVPDKSGDAHGQVMRPYQHIDGTPGRENFA